MNIREMVEKIEPYIIERRRYYHEYPEESFKEIKTIKELKKDLEKIGINDITLCKSCHGLWAMIKGGKPGKTIALRSDIDALKVEEETGLPFASKNGYMHACGHDNHMAMLLGAAKILNEIKDELKGNVKIIFQPAEEAASGAEMMIKEGVMDGVDAIYGAHIWGNFDAPLIDVTPGNRMAGCHTFTIKVEGTAAHGSAPNLGNDAIVAAASIITNLQSVVSRINDPLIPLVLTIGEIHGGQRFNIIANHVEMEGTVRTFSRDTKIEESIRNIIESTGKAMNVTATLDYRYLPKPVINENKELNTLAYNAVVKLYGKEGIGHLTTLMGSEDFSAFGTKAPYIFAFIGSRNVKKGCIYTNHHSKYDVDEDVLKRGAGVMVQFAYDYLENTHKE
jgi:amidohydrolase